MRSHFVWGGSDLISKVGQFSYKSDDNDIYVYLANDTSPWALCHSWLFLSGLGGGCSCQLSNYSEIELQEVTDRCKLRSWVGSHASDWFWWEDFCKESTVTTRLFAAFQASEGWLSYQFFWNDKNPCSHVCQWSRELAVGIFVLSFTYYTEIWCLVSLTIWIYATLYFTYYNCKFSGLGAKFPAHGKTLMLWR